jgi:hypothetical protein
MDLLTTQKKALNEDNVYRFTYGTGSGSVTHGISMRYVFFFVIYCHTSHNFFILQYNKNSQSVARDFPEELKKIASCVHDFVSSVYEKEEGVVIKPFNTAVVLLYYDRKDSIMYRFIEAEGKFQIS